jgi:hypothetical protein
LIGIYISPVCDREFFTPGADDNDEESDEEEEDDASTDYDSDDSTETV